MLDTSTEKGISTTKRYTLAIVVFTLLIASPAAATGLYSCDSGERSGWQPVDALETKMLAEDWQVRRIKEDGGCYEAYGTTLDGDRVEAYFDPVTLEVKPTKYSHFNILYSKR